MTNRLAFLAGVTFTLFALLTIRLIGLSLAPAEDTGATLNTLPETYSCMLLAPAGNSQAWEDLIETQGELDYSFGRIYSTRSGTIIGYALSEDGEVWNLPQCLSAD